MLESIEENFIYWILGTALTALALTVYGYVTGRNLPPQKRKLHIRKYGLIGLALIFFALPIFKPFVSSYSAVKRSEDLKAENLNSVEDLAEFEKEQARIIERLKQDVVELKNDTYRMNLYYSTLVQLLSTMVAVSALNFAFKKREDEEDEN